MSFDTTKHLSDSSLKKRHQERLKLQELERQREEQKRREKEEEERRREEERYCSTSQELIEFLLNTSSDTRHLCVMTLFHV